MKCIEIGHFGVYSDCTYCKAIFEVCIMLDIISIKWNNCNKWNFHKLLLLQLGGDDMPMTFFEPTYPVDPANFVGRGEEIKKFKDSVEQGISSSRTPSSAILGEWGIGKSSLLLKLNDILQKDYREILTLVFPVSKDLVDYSIFAQALLDRFHSEIVSTSKISNRIRVELKRWHLEKIGFSGISLERKHPSYFLSSGSALLRHNLEEIWRKFLAPAKIKAVVFFLDDLHNITRDKSQIALILRDLFQSLVVSGFNYSICFSAHSGYFGAIRELAEPATRFYQKIYLKEFSINETKELFKKVRETSNITVETSVVEQIHRLSLGHPYFLCFIINSLMTMIREGVIDSLGFKQLWPAIFDRMGESKFSEDFSHITNGERKFLLSIAGEEVNELSPTDVKKHPRVYFSRLTEKNLLRRIDRGKYKLYHPLFKEYLKVRE